MSSEFKVLEKLSFVYFRVVALFERCFLRLTAFGSSEVRRLAGDGGCTTFEGCFSSVADGFAARF